MIRCGTPATTRRSARRKEAVSDPPRDGTVDNPAFVSELSRRQATGGVEAGDLGLGALVPLGKKLPRGLPDALRRVRSRAWNPAVALVCRPRVKRERLAAARAVGILADTGLSVGARPPRSQALSFDDSELREFGYVFVDRRLRPPAAVELARDLGRSLLRVAPRHVSASSRDD